MSRRNLVGGVNVGLNPDASSKTTNNNHISNNVIIKTGASDKVEGVQPVPNGLMAAGSAGSLCPCGPPVACPLQSAPEIQVTYNDQIPYTDVEERDIESAKQTLKAFNTLGIPDSSYAEALTLIIDIIQNNPLIQNKFIVAHNDELCELIKLLTQSDEVVIKLSDDAACCGIKSVAKIESIYTIKNVDGVEQTSEFKYTHPLVKSLLNQLHISTKLLAVA